MSSTIVCSMPGCNTTVGCQCRNRAGISGWFGQIQKDAAASPIPPDFIAESANKSEHHAESAYCSDHIVDANKMVSAGLPSEALREIVKASLPSIAIAIEEWLFNSAADDKAASDIADLIRPAFEAVAADRDAWKAEKQRETNRAMAEINALHAEADRLAAARDAAEAKLADCAVYLKDGETPRQRMDRDHADVLGLIKLLEQEKRRTEAAEAKLAQAVADEREACAQIAEDKANTLDFRARATIASAIRARSAARGEKT